MTKKAWSVSRSGSQWYGSADPDPYQNVHNTAYVPYGISFDASPEESKADKGEAEPDENGHKAGQGRVPVTVAARLFFRAREQVKHFDCWFFVKAK